MRTKKFGWIRWVVLGMVAVIPFTAGHVLAAAPTCGEVLNQLAASLNKSPADLTAILFPAGGGCDPNAPATEAIIAQLFLALDRAIQGGALQGNAGSLMGAAAAKAGVPVDTVKSGISYGTTLSAGPGTRGPAGGMSPGGFGPGSAGAGGGGGVVGTQSR